MYIPPAFRVEDPARLAAFIQEHSFATLVTFEADAPFASHLPMLYQPHTGPHGTLVSHMARANPQWRHFASGREALVIFHGPHSYISPTWYQTEPAVPTWNYAVVHAYGVPAILTDHDRIAKLLQDTISTYESTLPRPWPGDLPNEFRDKLIEGIVAFEIPVARLEGKFKLSQNRPAADVARVIAALSTCADSESKKVARLMSAEADTR